jgi:hypothetical protein
MTDVFVYAFKVGDTEHAKPWHQRRVDLRPGASCFMQSQSAMAPILALSAVTGNDA